MVTEMHKVVGMLGAIMIIVAVIVFGYDCQACFQTGQWSTTTIAGALNLLELDRNSIIQIDQLEFVRPIFCLPFSAVSIALGLLTFPLGLKDDDSRR
jgi:hypothetical protein